MKMRKMPTVNSGCLAVALLGGGLCVQPVAAQVAGTAAAGTSPQRALLDKYCVTCHNERLKTAGLVLEKLDVGNVGEVPAVWEKVARKVRTGQMPPNRMPRPDDAAAKALVSYLEVGLDRAAAAHPNPGRVAVHRLNRTEYANAIRDLLDLEVNGRSLLPADDVDQHGFDNIASVLSVSPALLEAYISSARKVSRLAVGDTKLVPVFETYSIPSALTQDTRMSEDLPFASRGGIAIRHRFPVDGEYLVKIKLRRQLYGYILGMGRPHQIEVRLNRKRIQVFTIGGNAPPNGSPTTFAGNIMGDPQWDLYMHEADAGLEVRFPAKAGLTTVGVSFIKDVVEPEDIPQPRGTGFGLAVDEMFDGSPAVDSVMIGGPYDPKGPGETASRRRIFTCRPAQPANELSCARQILSALSRHAYRRPVTEQEVQTLLRFYETGRSQGGFEDGIRLALERILADPNFLFRIERDPVNAPAGTVYRLSDLELASRVSFFLWSSIPDEELLSVATQGKLKDPRVLEQQVRRMLGDTRSDAMVDNFASEWLELRKLRSATPDANLFPDFDENLRQAFQKETELFLKSQMRADRGIVEMLTANYTFVNERLAQHYGIPNIYGNHFRQVTLSGEDRGGLLAQGSVLVATSYPNRTSPVIRGKWLLDNILGMPPPPPPPAVPALKESGANGKASSVRERMEEHRKNAVCATCHVRMDPLGFALENYDAIGKWRTVSDGAPIDASAAFIDGTQFQGMAGLRKLVASHRQDFVSIFTEKLLTYALGREVESYDFPAVRKITQEAAAGDYRWSAIITGIVKSLPFQMSVVRTTTPGQAAALQAPPIPAARGVDALRSSLR
jgi:mono/diheme cytochrome c family protein